MKELNECARSLEPLPGFGALAKVVRICADQLTAVGKLAVEAAMKAGAANDAG